MNFYKIVKYLVCWLNVIMSDKGFTNNQTNIKTPSDNGVAEKSLTNQTVSGRVDINVLKSKLQESESKEFKKNITILSALILALSFLGVYLSF